MSAKFKQVIYAGQKLVDESGGGGTPTGETITIIPQQTVTIQSDEYGSFGDITKSVVAKALPASFDVVLDGVTYKNVPDSGGGYYGAPFDDDTEEFDFSDYPFSLYMADNDPAICLEEPAATVTLSASYFTTTKTIIENGQYDVTNFTGADVKVATPYGQITVNYTINPSARYFATHGTGIYKYYKDSSGPGIYEEEKINVAETAEITIEGVILPIQQGFPGHAYWFAPNFTDISPSEYKYEISISNLVNLMDASSFGASGTVVIFDPTEPASCSVTVTRTSIK